MGQKLSIPIEQSNVHCLYSFQLLYIKYKTIVFEMHLNVTSLLHNSRVHYYSI